MGRRLAGSSKIARRGHDAPAEMMLPKSIHHHAGKQAGALACARPLAEFGPAANRARLSSARAFVCGGCFVFGVLCLGEGCFQQVRSIGSSPPARSGCGAATWVRASSWFPRRSWCVLGRRTADA